MVKKDDMSLDQEVNEKRKDDPRKAPSKPSVEATSNREDKILTSKYMFNVLTDKDKEVANDLYESCNQFLNKNYGISAKDTEIKSTIPFGIDVLDAVLGGGVGTTLVQIVGLPATGKSTLAAKLISSGQRKFPGKFLGYYLDSEGSTTRERLSELGVRYPEIDPIQPESVEEVFRIVDAICLYKEKNTAMMEVPSVIIWDSIANTATEAELATTDPNKVLGVKARILSQNFKLYASKLNKYNISLVGINQLRQKIDVGVFKSKSTLRKLGDKIIPGGLSTAFNTFQLLHLSTDTVFENYGFSALRLSGITIKNKLFTPEITFNLVMSHKRGFSNFWTNFDFLKECKRITVAGPWCTLIGYEEQKFQQKQSIELYRKDEKFRNIFDEQVKECISLEIIEKYRNVQEDNVDVYGIATGEDEVEDVVE